MQSKMQSNLRIDQRMNCMNKPQGKFYTLHLLLPFSKKIAYHFHLWYAHIGVPPTKIFIDFITPGIPVRAKTSMSALATLFAVTLESGINSGQCVVCSTIIKTNCLHDDDLGDRGPSTSITRVSNTLSIIGTSIRGARSAFLITAVFWHSGHDCT